MPTVTNPTLSLTTVNQNVQIRVGFNVRFNEFERKLAGLGLIFRSSVEVRGVDAPASQLLTVFPAQTFPVTSGDGAQVVQFNETITRTRASLQEDVGLGDNDEIQCRIRVRAVGMPPEATIPISTNEVVLLG